MNGGQTEQLNYVETALCVSLLLESKAVEFIKTACSSGQGMMLACSSLPGVICGYVQSPADVFLFRQINNGNAVSYPLGLNWGWAGEINFTETIRALFGAPFGAGYPALEASRKKRDTERLKQMNYLCKKRLTDVLLLFGLDFIRAALHYDIVYQYVLENGTDEGMLSMLCNYRAGCL